MLRAATVAAVAAALVLPFAASADSTPVGPLPKGPVSAISTPKGSLVAVALKSRAGYSWRLARNVRPTILVQVSEANVGSSVVVVFRAVGRGTASVRYGLTRGETRKAYAAATFNVRVR